MSVFIYSALILGLLSSLHCLGMCGPIVIGILPPNSNPLQKSIILILYHTGRLMVYGLLGVLAGFIGEKFFIGSFQQSLSIGLGVIILIWLSGKFIPIFKHAKINFIHTFFNKLMGRFLLITNNSKYLFLGGLNGLLPCGMVYIAMAGAFSMNSVFDSFLFMVLFGFGTLPLLVAVSGIGLYFKAKIKNNLRLIQPIFLIIFACLLIVRGLDLGVPYLSPHIVKTVESTKMECCKKK